MTAFGYILLLVFAVALCVLAIAASTKRLPARLSEENLSLVSAFSLIFSGYIIAKLGEWTLGWSIVVSVSVFFGIFIVGMLMCVISSLRANTTLDEVDTSDSSPTPPPSN
jgi:NADH:ubiquinone oxidoreductase subunit H